MKKKLLTLALAGVLALSSSSMALAADTVVEEPGADSTYSATVDVTTDTKVPVIKVTVPGELTVGINPYKLAYEISGDEYTDSLANVEQTITNESDVAISISATVKAETVGEAVLATSALKGTETTKSIFAYLEIKEKADANPGAAFATAYDSKATNQIAFTAKDTTKKDMVELAAKATDPTYAGFKIFGDVAAKPAKAWTSGDKLNMTLVFTIDPKAATSESSGS